MADIAHLEKMGRELKCPICLSLLYSAASLTCNHVFCNLCILKSMKSASNCPVCKVPFQRREVRPAPHMDNLVNIYKSMEVASGINVFTTQIAPETGLSDGQNQPKERNDLANLKIGGKTRQGNKKKRNFEGKDTEPVKANEKLPSPHLAKPSFPAKKRVHVPQYPLSETPARLKRSDEGFGKSVEQERLDSPVLPNKKPTFTEVGEPMLSPFFWLKERNPEDDDDADKFCSQHTEDDTVMDTPQKAPSFSDLKDSDDETPTKLTDNEEVHNGFRIGDAFDSEIFEWTQRACSPELCSTPIKNQISSAAPHLIITDVQEVKKDQLFVIQEESHVTLHVCTTSHGGQTISENLRSISAKQGAENRNADLSNSSSPANETSEDAKEKRKFKKRAKRTNGRSLGKRLKLSLDKDHGEVTTDSGDVENLNEGNRCNINDDALYYVRRNIRRGKKTGSIATILGKGQNVSTGSTEAEIRNQRDGKMSLKFSVSAAEEPSNDENLVISCKARKGGDTDDTHHQKYPKRTKSRRVDGAIAEVLTEIPMNTNQVSKNIHAKMPLSSIPKASNSVTPLLDENNNRVVKMGEKRRKKRLNTHTDAKSKDESVDEVLDDSNNDNAKKTKSSEHLQENLQVKAQRKLETNDKVLSVANDRFLHKCETLSNQIQCAFCRSSQCSEASGEMMHYVRGMPVALDYDGESTIIHSHKKCTEWAPNVYFEDDTAVNLETELARSRRIKCSCCGIKGAALGCFEKSCRKSFHVPCAKLVSQCRWDDENYVVLCPLHTSSKLPCETSGPQQKGRKRFLPKVESNICKISVPVKNDLAIGQQWKHSGSSNKWIFCCSALAEAEKKTVSEFAKLAGISVAKTWCSSITHVIASTNENGACKRTLKFLMGVLEGKWIMKIDWIKACMDALRPVSEAQHEICVDVHGITDGPRLGRLRVLNKQPKLFNAFAFYLMGEFTPSYKGYLQDLVVAAGGTVLQRKPISKDKEILLSGSSKSIFIIYSLELPDKSDSASKAEICNRRRVDAETLANSAGAKVVSNSWVLDSIAACKVQSLV